LLCLVHLVPSLEKSALKSAQISAQIEISLKIFAQIEDVSIFRGCMHLSKKRLF